MIPWEQLGTGEAPGGGVLKLARRGAEFSIRIGHIELMNSRLSGSEEALATLAAERIGGKAAPHVLIGGLGMGFTLRAALSVLPADARITVAELAPCILDWAKGPMAEIFGDCLADPRVNVLIADVAAVMRKGRRRYDAILLDVDNGPEALTSRGNDALYALAGIGEARAALKKGGVLAIWSQGPDDAFSKRLRQSRFLIEDIRVKANKGRKGARHVIWLATRPD